MRLIVIVCLTESLRADISLRDNTGTIVNTCSEINDGVTVGATQGVRSSAVNLVNVRVYKRLDMNAKANTGVNAATKDDANVVVKESLNESVNVCVKPNVCLNVSTGMHVNVYALLVVSVSPL